MTKNQSLSQIYLDSNATTPVLPAAAKAAFNAMEETFGNPSSSHITGLRAKNLMEQTRKSAMRFLGVGNGKLVFTSGATEGIQTAILSSLVAAKKNIKSGESYTLLYGATEHKAVPNSLHHWNELLEINAEIKAIPVNHRGELDLDFIEKEIDNALMICTMAVNNETGVYQDLNKLEQAIRSTDNDVFWMVDCVQALGKRKLDLQATTIDYAPFSGHKLYAPKGVGLVYIRENAPFTPFIAGGGQESGLRSGTENLPGMAALKVIFDTLNGDAEDKFADHTQLTLYRNQLLSALKEAFPDVVLNHPLDNTVPTTLNFAVPHFASKEIMDLFDAANIRVSSGSACSSKVTRSFVLDAMGLPSWQSESAIRMSFGPLMTQEKCDAACARIKMAAKALGESCLMVKPAENQKLVDGLLELKSGNSCCWLYTDADSKTAVIIDPLPELISRIVNIVNCQKLKVAAVLDTHGHADHQSSRPELEAQLKMVTKTDQLGWPKHFDTAYVGENAYPTIRIGDKALLRVKTPGHTDDSVSYLLTENIDAVKPHFKYAFCGDTILMGSLGRTNFCTSSSEQMYHSLHKLNELLASTTLICASHDYHNEFTTTLITECDRNTLLSNVLSTQSSINEFCEQKSVLDSNLNDQTGCEIQCGAYVEIDESLPIVEYDKNELSILLEKDHDAKLVDIREPHEYMLQHGIKAEENVPMTRLVEFIAQHLSDKDKRYILVCRSGTRSLVVAQALARLGFTNIGHVQGGYALNS
ncbi:aminotransferase class V [Shewanella sp. OPT22]|nr:aminotransferase class V [Shewanella sp. OPT22]